MGAKTLWMRLGLAGAVAVAMLALTACSDDGGNDEATGAGGVATAAGGEVTATPAGGALPVTTETPESVGPIVAGEEPPVTTASANGETVETGTGTFCWTRLCVDKIGVPTRGTLMVSSGDTVSVAIPEGVPALRDAGASVFEALNAMPLDDGGEIWPYAGAPGEEVAYEVGSESVDVVIDLAPGRYVLSVFMAFEQGDVVYGVLLEVE